VEPHIKEGKNAVIWTRLSCHRFAANAVRLQLHALAYNLADFLRTLALPGEISHWSTTALRRSAGEDRRQDRPTRKLDHIPGGRGNGLTRAVPADPRRHRGATSAATGAMLRTIDMPGQPDCRQETCVPMRAPGSKFTLKQGSTHRRRDCQRRPVDLNVE